MSDLQVGTHFVIPAGELREHVSTSGGPGGQHANKTSTRVTLRWNVNASAAPSASQKARLLERLASRLTKDGDVLVQVDETRSQSENRLRARQRLAAMLTSALVRAKPRKATRPTRASQRRRVDKKKRRGAIKRGRGRVQNDD